MALLTGTILMRRGQLKDLVKSNMQAGEFAVCIDNDTKNKRVFLGFGNDVVKELGTFEDFEDRFKETYKELLDLAVKLDLQENYILTVQSDIKDNIYPDIQYLQQEVRNDKNWIDSAIQKNIPEFFMNFVTGELEYYGGMFDFLINPAGELEWKVA